MKTLKAYTGFSIIYAYVCLNVRIFSVTTIGHNGRRIIKENIMMDGKSE